MAQAEDEQITGRYAEAGHMLRGFITFLDDYLDRVGAVGLIKASLGILAFTSVLSALFGATAIKASALVIATLCLLGVLVLLTTHHRKLRVQADHHCMLLSHYCDLLTTEMDHMWHIHRWAESIDISSNGDETGSITIHASVEVDFLYFLRIVIGPCWKQPEKARGQVRVTLAGLDTDQVGASRWKETTFWKPDGRLEVLAHCVFAPPKRGDQIRLHLDYTWPEKSAPLMRFDRSDTFVVTFGRPLDHLSYRIALPVGTRVKHETIGLQPDHDFDVSAFSGGHQHPVIELVARDIEADRRVGMRLDLK